MSCLLKGCCFYVLLLFLQNFSMGHKGRVIYYQLGGPVIFRGGRKFFWWCTGGLKIKLPMGRGGHVFCQVLGGSDVFHWSFFSLKVIASGGGGRKTPPPLHPSSIMWDFLNHWGDIGNKICPILVKQIFFFKCRPLLLVLSIIITIISARVLVVFYFA